MFGKYAVFPAGSASRRTQFPKPRCDCQAAFNLQHWGSLNSCSRTPLQPFLQPDMKGVGSLPRGRRPNVAPRSLPSFLVAPDTRPRLPVLPTLTRADTTSVSLGPWDPYLIN